MSPLRSVRQLRLGNVAGGRGRRSPAEDRALPFAGCAPALALGKLPEPHKGVWPYRRREIADACIAGETLAAIAENRRISVLRKCKTGCLLLVKVILELIIRAGRKAGVFR